MDIFKLIRYFRGQATKAEEESVKDWLSVDEPERAEFYRKAHTLFCAMVLYDDAQDVKSIQCEQEDRINPKIRFFQKSWFKQIAVAAVLIISVLITATLTRNYTVDTLAQNIETITAPVGGPMKMTLEDGTEMWVKGGSTVKYPSVFARKSRNVEVVSGEVCFDVMRDEDRPFIVNTFASDITVLGTRFSVKVGEIDKMFSTSLLRGSVKVKSKLSDNECFILSPNQKVEMVDSHLHVAPIDDVAIVDWWTSEVMEIAGVPFDMLMKRLELIYDVDIDIRSDKMPENGYTWGKIRIAGGLENALTVIAKASDFTWEKDAETGKIIIR